MRIHRAIGFIAMFAVGLPSQAALIDMDTFVRDDVTMIDYLKLDQTFGYSWDQVVTTDALGFIVAGWSVTSQAGLSQLAAADFSARGLIGGSLVAYSNWVVFTDQDLSGGQSSLPGNVRYDIWSTVNVYSLDVGEYASTSQSTFDGVSLSREAPVVPVPAAGYLLLSALAGLVGGRRAARKK